MTSLSINQTGEVLVSTHTPMSPDELIDYKLAIDNLVRNAPTTEITIIDAGQIWFSGVVGNVGPQFNQLASDLGGGRNVVFGTKNSDKMSGTPGDDYFVGDAGNDIITYNGGDDVIIGGLGTDSVFFPGNDLGNLFFTRHDSQTVTAHDHTNGDNVTLIGIENVLFSGQGWDLSSIA